MAQATLFSDLKLLLITAVRVWGAEDLEAFDVLCQDRYPAGAPLPGEGCD
jgi:hypothetical protein